MENYLDVQNDNYSKEKLIEAGKIIKAGGIVLFPTETVYALGTNGLDSKAVEKLYKIKQRSLKNPINLLVDSIEMIETLTQSISPIEYKLMKNFFPGPFTIILKKKSIIPNIVTANSEFVGVRIPDNDIALKLIQYAQVPISSPSANISGRPSGTNLIDIKDEFNDKIDFIINGGKSPIGIESTIVQVINNIPHILRPGYITPEQIKKVAGNVSLDNGNLLLSSKMKHYQLDSKSTVVYSKDNKKMAEKIINLSKEYNNPIIVCYEQNIKLYKDKLPPDIIFSTSFKNLFSTLRNVNKLSPDIIIIEGVEKTGFGIAIMNRLLNVCNNNYIEIN